MAYGDFASAEIYYNKLLQKAPDNPVYNFEMGAMLFLTGDRKSRAIPYLEKARDFRVDENSTPDMYYYLGQCYQIAGRYDEAIEAYNSFKNNLKSTKKGLSLQQEVNRRIESCNHAKIFSKSAVRATITNAGENINSPELDYGAVLSSDQTMMYFTSRRTGNFGEKAFDETYQRMLNNEDIYQASISVGNGMITFDKAKKASTHINTTDHDAVIGISKDNLKLFLYRDNDLWYSQKAGRDWGEQKRLSQKFNTKKGQETSIAISPGQDHIFIVSNRKGGYGGKDIYESVLQADGSWSPLINLGPTINTSYDEESPYLSDDGKTLFFSSKGHSSMGGFDIFASSYEKGDWTAPKNIGYPINSSSDDVFFTVDPTGHMGVFTSDREDGLGSFDIYQVKMEKEDIPVTEVRGIVLAGAAKSPIGAKITVTNTSTGVVVGYYSSNEDTASSDHGKYLLVLSPGEEYNLLVEAEGYKPYNQDIFVPAEFEYHQMYQEIHLGEDNSTMYNALFDIDTQYDNAYSYIEKQLTVDPEYAEYLKKDNMYSAYINTLIKIDKILSEDAKVVNDGSKPAADKSTENGIGLSDFFTPDELLAVMADSLADQVIILPNIEFDYNRATLQEPSKIELNKLYTFMKNSPKTKIEFRAHTDDQGDDDFNLRLSQSRANAVKDYLVSKGIDAGRINAVGYGEYKPIAPNILPDGSDNPKGRQKNRRIEVKITL